MITETVDWAGGPVKKSRFSPEQILPALRQAQSGTVAGEICWKLGVTKDTFDRWREQ
ncbi:MAG: transposase [Gemmatimonadaceae bacterium]|nr:transposase [Gemmatimonadaceae bacterium]